MPPRSPFFYFADHKAEIADLVARGRAESPGSISCLGNARNAGPAAGSGRPQTFTHSKLDLNDRNLHKDEYALHRDLLSLRRNDPVFQASQHSNRIDGAVLSQDAWVIRFFGEIRVTTVFYWLT